MDKTAVSKATLGRLPLYLQLLQNLPEKEYPYISATAIAKKLSLGEVQVRKDLSAISGAGKPKLGYLTNELISTLENHLGLKSLTLAVLVGAGKLGRALLDYDEFEKYGVKIAAAFDSNSEILNVNGKVAIQPISSFEEYCKAQKIQLGIITVGEGSAQTVCNKMVECGITAILNFAPCKLNVPRGVILKNENLALSLAYLNNQISN